MNTTSPQYCDHIGAAQANANEAVHLTGETTNTSSMLRKWIWTLEIQRPHVHAIGITCNALG
jgi:hypothetical protein